MRSCQGWAACDAAHASSSLSLHLPHRRAACVQLLHAAAPSSHSFHQRPAHRAPAPPPCCLPQSATRCTGQRRCCPCWRSAWRSRRCSGRATWSWTRSWPRSWPEGPTRRRHPSTRGRSGKAAPPPLCLPALLFAPRVWRATGTVERCRRVPYAYACSAVHMCWPGHASS